MAVSKVILNGTTLMDVTQKTVNTGNLLSGATALKNDGTDIVGLIPQRSYSDVVFVGAEVQVPAGYYSSTARKNMPSGTAGTPTAAKGTVSNHSVSVTPSVTNTTGYITGDTKTGTAVTVTASELESGTKSITENGTGIDVTGYSAVDVAVSGGGSANIQPLSVTANGTYTASGEPIDNLINSKRINDDAQNSQLLVDLSGFSVGDICHITGSICHESQGSPITSTISDMEKTFTWTGSAYSYTSNIMTLTVTSSYISVSSSQTGSIYGYPASDQYLKFYKQSPGIDGYSPVTVNVSGGSDNQLKSLIDGTATSLTLPSNLTSIRAYCFYLYSTLTDVSMPNGLTSIGERAFQGCTSLAITSLPNTITSIAQYAFYNCTQLALTSFPSSLTTISMGAFANCTKITATSLPSSIYGALGNYAFDRCGMLAISEIPSGVTSIGQYTFEECNSIINISFPSTVTVINSNAFYNCANLESASGTGVLTSIAANAFTRCPKLKTASFPNANVSALGSYAFGYSSAGWADKLLEFVDLGSTNSIGANAFTNCYALETLVLRRSNAICSLANVNAFTNTPMNGYNSMTGTVYVPSDLISTYQTATNWSTLYNNGTVTFTAIEGSDYELD